MNIISGVRLVVSPIRTLFFLSLANKLSYQVPKFPLATVLSSLKFFFAFPLSSIGQLPSNTTLVTIILIFRIHWIMNMLNRTNFVLANMLLYTNSVESERVFPRVAYSLVHRNSKQTRSTYIVEKMILRSLSRTETRGYS